MKEESKTNQRSKILDLIHERGSATVRDIFTELNINSPTKRLSELRKMGVIKEDWDFNLHEDGSKVRFKRYTLNE